MARVIGSVVAGLSVFLFLGWWLSTRAAGPDASGMKATSGSATSAATGVASTSQPEIADLGAASPRALLESMAKVLGEDSKPNASLVFQSPANRDLAREQLALALQLGARTSAVSDLVQVKIGKVEAGMIRSMQGGVTAGGELMLRNAIAQFAKDGNVDWDKIKITETGDKAQAEITNYGGTISLVRAGGKWYLGEQEGQATFAQDAAGTKAMTGNLMKVLDQVEQKVNSGEINKKNFFQKYPEIVNTSLNPDRK